MTDLTMRPLNWDDDAEIRAWADLTSHVFQYERSSDADLAFRRERSADQRVTVVEDSGDLVAAFRSYATTLSVPGGGLVPADAISGVVVQPTHKRRGLLTRWITADLEAARERGDVAAALFASEAGIYGRYGFGCATANARWRLDVPRTRFLRPATGRVKVADADVIRPVASDLYEAAQRRTVGSIQRAPSSWTLALGPTDLVEGSHKRWHAIHLAEASVVPDGLLTYRVSFDWGGGLHRSELVVEDLLAATDDAENALLQYACNVDFLGTVELGRAPGWGGRDLLVDPRAAQLDHVLDGLWVRLLDVARALSAREYRVDGELVVDVEDPLLVAGGRWRLTVRDGRGICEPTTDAPDLGLGIDALGSLWLGGDVGVPSLPGLVRSGRATATPEAVALATAMFGTVTAPFSLTHF